MFAKKSFISVCENPEALIEQIPDASLTASSVWRNATNLGPIRSRLTTLDDESGHGGWSSWQVDTNQWIQADFSTIKTIFKVATKGRNEMSNSYSQWVTKYQLKYALSSMDFEYVTSSPASTYAVTFNANSDRDSVVENGFVRIFARFLRLCPIEWYGHISLRWEAYGC